jgi:two-component system response regulator FixJ
MAEAGPIYVVDDDSGMRESLRFLLESRGFAATAFASAQDFLRSGLGQGNGCVIVDVRMPDMTGLELQQQLNAQNSHLQVVVITGHADVGMAVGAMKAGAIDFIEKPFSDEALLASVSRALERSRRRSARRDSSAEIDERLQTLTAREREVFDHLVTGNPHKAIAYELKISPRTIEVHRSRIMQKLGARSLADLVRMTIASADPRMDE